MTDERLKQIITAFGIWESTTENPIVLQAMRQVVTEVAQEYERDTDTVLDVEGRQPHPQAAILIAIAQGKTIQCLSKDRKWFDLTDPLFMVTSLSEKPVLRVKQ